MKAISLWQPYLAGVLSGDAWCTPLTVGLRCKDRDFAVTFAAGLTALYAVRPRVKRDERGYWLVRVSNKRGIFNGMRKCPILTPEDAAAWLRGVFDSEGNADLRPLKISKNAKDRRVAFYTTDVRTAALIIHRLKTIALPSRDRVMKRTLGHKGTKPVIEVRLLNSEENFTRFATLVGSSLGRKRRVLEALAASYGSRRDYCRRGQRAGAATRRRRTVEVRLPTLLAAIKALSRTQSPTYRRCMQLSGYWSARQTLGLQHSEIVRMAR